MKKGNGKKTLRAVLAAALGAVLLMSLAWAGVSDVTGGGSSNVYKHTYHTNVKGTATIQYLDSDGTVTRETTVTHESGFLKGNLSDEAVQAQIAAFYAKVDEKVNGLRATKVSESKQMQFDHFESSNVIDPSGGVSKNLDVHEYQNYMITEEWVVEPSSVTVITTVKNEYTDTYDTKTLTLTKGTNTFEGMGSYVGNGEWDQAEGTMTVQFNGLSTPVNITYSVANDVVTMTVTNYDQLPNGVYSGEVETRMTTTHTGSALDYKSEQDENGKWVFNETRYDYYNRHHWKMTLTLTVNSGAVTPSGGSSYSGPYVTAVLTAPDAKSATDFSGGIYGLTFRANTPFSGFLGVQVDGKTIDKSCYIAEENGGTEIYLKAVYLQTLAAGKHTMTVLSSAGDATTEFTIGGLNTAPKTFDAGVAVYGVTAVLALGGMAWMGKKKEF